MSLRLVLMSLRLALMMVYFLIMNSKWCKILVGKTEKN